MNKIALCAIAKHENLYIRDWVEYHLNLGFNHIYLFDNNESTYESITEIIRPFKSNVTILNIRDKSAKDFQNGRMQQYCYKYCFNKYKNEYDWMAFFDIDEFLYINGETICEFLNEFKTNSIIHINWKSYGDNDRLYYENVPVFERFQIPVPNNLVMESCLINSKPIYENSQVKSILNCKYNIISDDTDQINLHTFIMDGGECTDAKHIKNNMTDFLNYNFDGKYYLKHFRTKTITEYLDRRLNRLSPCAKETYDKKTILNNFFKYNKWTPEKEMIIRKYGIKYKDI